MSVARRAETTDAAHTTSSTLRALGKGGREFAWFQHEDDGTDPASPGSFGRASMGGCFCQCRNRLEEPHDGEVARPAGLEPATLGLEGHGCSMHLSYGRKKNAEL